MHTSRFFLSLFLLICAQSWAGPQTWITNVNLVSPEKLDRIEAGSVLIEDDRIVRVERGAAAKAPAGAQKIDGKGYFLTPGLIDSHVHLHAVPGHELRAGRRHEGHGCRIFRADAALLPLLRLYDRDRSGCG